jgi:hypothetical protein
MALIAAEWTRESTHYDVLDVTPDMSTREVQRAYRRAALLEHPDKSDRPDAEERFRRVAEAFEVLGDETRAAQYAFDLSHGRTGNAGASSGMSAGAAYDLFKTHLGDVYRHWEPGLRVEGYVLRNHERVYVVLFPDGSSKVQEPTDSGMHTFTRIGEGWCLFERQPDMIEMENTYETTCRETCVKKHPDCGGYAFEQGSRLCEIYKRMEPAQKVVGVNVAAGVTCYQQNDTAFDMSSNVYMSEIKITQPDGTTSNISTELFCQRGRAGSIAYNAPRRLKRIEAADTSSGGSVLSVAHALWYVTTHPAVLLQGNLVETLGKVIGDLWSIFSSPSTLQKIAKEAVR